MARDQQVQAELLTQALIPAPLVATRKVCHHNLPVRGGCRQLLLKPALLCIPRAKEPVTARPDVGHAVIARALRASRVVRPRADVLLLVLSLRFSVEDVRVKHKILNVESRVLDLLVVVPRRHDPVVVDEGIADLLRPTLVELPTAIVVVAQHAKPRDVGNFVIDRLPCRREVALGLAPGRSRRNIAIHLDTAEVKVVADVKHVLRLSPLRAVLHGVRHGVL
mmetsp:Transcript_24192/g.67903  ORF Transcript_24192/g.67903 Transcript_24192/m.67903 type:complete len:222 (+) Transcript_24192:475-1140(+)